MSGDKDNTHILMLTLAGNKDLFEHEQWDLIGSIVNQMARGEELYNRGLIYKMQLDL